MSIIAQSLEKSNVFFIFRNNGIEVKIEVEQKDKIKSNFKITPKEFNDLSYFLENNFEHGIRLKKNIWRAINNN